VALLRRLREIGYEVGSGIMVGIPGQSYPSLARDLELFADLELDMIGVGPYIADPDTPLGAPGTPVHPDQVPATEEMVYRVLALARLQRPDANIPATTALATINRRNGRQLGLQRGANVVMPNATPPQYRERYRIYPNKACANETASQCRWCIVGKLHGIGRKVGTGPGTSPAFARRGEATGNEVPVTPK
jgi:biotin synthase